jgi:hypothetical protein
MSIFLGSDNLLISSPTLKGLEKAIQNYYYSPSIFLEQETENKWSVNNSKGIINSVVVIKKGKRYRFEKK